MPPVIRIENLSKQYVIRHAARRNPADSGFRHAVERGVQMAVRDAVNFICGRSATNHDDSRSATTEKFWALKDVSFEVQQGECVGIIGRNGAGKSTLLKILSRITEPTSGIARLRGRVGCLLEVGTGFHPELTGRENIYLNGAILGMKRAEVGRKFDEIVAFAGVDKFVDTPVKHYSSGMYMRLAFAVAAHLEPEILIVDEVLAVGDAEFQRKCLGKMDEVTRAGRTVLFVSHNLAAMQSLCSRGILLNGGQIDIQGDIPSVISAHSVTERRQAATGGYNSQTFEGGLTLEYMTVTPTESSPYDPIEIEFRFSAEEHTSLTELCLIIYSNLDMRVGIVDCRPHKAPFTVPIAPATTIKCSLEPMRLVEGKYSVGLYAVSSRTTVNINDAAVLVVTAHGGLQPSTYTAYKPEYRGVVEFVHECQIRQ